MFIPNRRDARVWSNNTFADPSSGAAESVVKKVAHIGDRDEDYRHRSNTKLRCVQWIRKDQAESKQATATE